MRHLGVTLAAALVSFSVQGCYESHVRGPDGTIIGDSCRPSVDEGDTYYMRFEAPDHDNSCRRHSDCSIGGCSGEICAAEAMASTCELLPTHPRGECGCAGGECIWYLGECSP
jgi:eight-cysteine-cluster-containing protein